MFDIVWDPVKLSGDWKIDDNGDLSSSDALQTAIIMCLFTDRPLPEAGAGVNDNLFLRAWHGDTYDLEEAEKPLGSYLWTLARVSLQDIGYVKMLARNYALEALHPLVQQGLVQGFDIEVELVDDVGLGGSSGRINMRIRALGKDERAFEFVILPEV